MSPVLDIYGVLLAKVENKSVRLPIKFYPESGSHHLSKVETLALLDSGAGGDDATYRVSAKRHKQKAEVRPKDR